MSENQPPITMGEAGQYCSPECPYLQQDSQRPWRGSCAKDDKPLGYYDWHLAHCNDQLIMANNLEQEISR